MIVILKTFCLSKKRENAIIVLLLSFYFVNRSTEQSYESTKTYKTSNTTKINAINLLNFEAFVILQGFADS